MELPTYKFNKRIYTVDYRLEQFRTIKKTDNFHAHIEFIDFDDELGDRILSKMIRDNVADTSKLNL